MALWFATAVPARICLASPAVFSDHPREGSCANRLTEFPQETALWHRLPNNNCVMNDLHRLPETAEVLGRIRSGFRVRNASSWLARPSMLQVTPWKPYENLLDIGFRAGL